MLHPALRELLRFQLVARCRRASERFRRPRRLILSVVAVLLGFLWLGQAILGILFRAPADPQRLMTWIPLGFAAYASWHVLKVIVRSPIEPFEWTPTETELLSGAPLTRPDLVRYRLAGIVVPASMKAACFALIMIPDLHLLWAGCVGMFLALVALDLVRMLTEVLVFGVRRNTFLWLRCTILAMAVALGLRVTVPVLANPEVLAAPHTLVVLREIFDQLVVVTQTTPGGWLMGPFRLFGQVILAPDFAAPLLFNLTAATGVVLVLTVLVMWLDRLLWTRRIERERSEFRRACSRRVEGAQPSVKSSSSLGTWRQPWHLAGAGSLAWRQAWGVRKYEVSVLMSLIVPGLLSLLPMCGSAEAKLAAVQMIGSLVFYSLVLLPAAFKFDFRRDLDRIVVLKTLPIHPWAAVAGQLAIPVALCTTFQVAVMLIGMCIRPYSWAVLGIATCILLLANGLIFALENLIFLLYPYRLNQEGIDIFLRSIIVLTAKTVLFGVGLAVTLGWAFVSGWTGPALLVSSQQVFFAGMTLTLLTCWATVFALLVRVYRGFDPSQDVPALS